jgi:hypothetical protein
MRFKKNISFRELLELHSETDEVDSVDPFFFTDSGSAEHKIKSKCQFCNTTKYSMNGVIETCQCKESILHQQKLVEQQKIFNNNNKKIRFKNARMKNKCSIYRKIK